MKLAHDQLQTRPGRALGAPFEKPAASRPIDPWWVLGIGFVVWLGARLVPYAPLPLPVCGLRALTGVPCPFCGSTRSLMAWSHLDVATAFRFNPMVAAACLALMVWVALLFLDRWFNRSWAAYLMARLQRRPWPVVLLGVALVNWIYLILFLPK